MPRTRKPKPTDVPEAMCFDALRVKIRDEATVRSKAVYLSLAILPDGSRDILGIWIEQTEGAKFWMKVFTDLKARGCHDAEDDGLRSPPSPPSPPFTSVYLRLTSVKRRRQRDTKPNVSVLSPFLRSSVCETVPSVHSVKS